MTEEQRQRFAELYREYEARSRALTTEHVNRIHAACAEARAYAKAPNTIGTRAVREFVMPLVNKVAVIAGAPDAVWANKHMDRTESVFIPLLKEIFGFAASNERITREQFCEWRKKFFDFAGYNANQTFNRLVFPCFPKQFCSVVAPSRLKAAIGIIHNKGFMASIIVDKKSDGAWFDLCEAVVPVVQSGLQDFDLASQVSFLAAIADGGPRE